MLFVRCGRSVPLQLIQTAPACLLTGRMLFFLEEPMRTVEQRNGIWRLSLEQIEATVADHLGNGRVPGNQSAPCLSRQVSMYLAKNVVGWSTTKIGRSYTTPPFFTRFRRTAPANGWDWGRVDRSVHRCSAHEWKAVSQIGLNPDGLLPWSKPLHTGF